MAVTNITIAVDNSILPTVANALAWKGGYQAMIDDGTGTGTQMANPVTKNAFAKQVIIKDVMNIVADYQNMVAQQSVVPPASNLIS